MGMNVPSRKSMFAVLLVLALTASSCGWLDSLSARNELNLGVQAYTNKKYDEAIEHFEESIEKDPDLARSYLYLAISYRAQYVPQGTSPANLERARMAIATFEEVIDRATEEVDKTTAMANLAGIYNGMGDYERAKEWYRKRLEMEPDNPVPMYGIATIDWQLSYDETGMTGESVDFLSEERSAQINELVDEGIESLKNALEINPTYVDAMQYLNLLYREKAKLATEEEEKRTWEREADKLALQALEVKREQEEAEAEARRQVMAGEEE
jgi:tetratricopeptide (TPR) repeat protein